MSTPNTTPNPFAMPMNDLAAAAGITGNEPSPAAPAATPAPPAATPAPAPVVPEKYSIAQDDSGFTITLSPEYGGEVFKGKDLNEVVTKLAASKADGNAYIKTLKAQPTPAVQTEPAPTPTPEDPAEVATRQWMLEQFAKGLGLSGAEELQARMGMISQTSETMATNIALAEFHQQCPGYVDTPENSGVLAEYIGDIDHFPTARELKQAYALAVLDGKIAPQAAPPAAPKAPPVMPSSTATPNAATGQNPWAMPLDQLAAIAGINQ